MCNDGTEGLFFEWERVLHLAFHPDVTMERIDVPGMGVVELHQPAEAVSI